MCVCSRSLRCMQELWALIMDAGTGFTAQTYSLSNHFLPKEWIMVRGPVSLWEALQGLISNSNTPQTGTHCYLFVMCTLMPARHHPLVHSQTACAQPNGFA